jgi:hypothetical protein
LAAMNERAAAGGSDQALRRVLGGVGGPACFELLADELAGADLTTLLLEVLRRRAARVRPADVFRRYRSDRFVAPAAVDLAALRRAEDAFIGALPGGFETIVLAPVVPLGTHTATGEVDPRNVIATIRGTEVAADPTNGLALEAAARRGELLRCSPRTADLVRLAASQRVTRAQLFEGPVSFAHFQLLGVVTAGRDTGGHEFERRHLAEHARLAAVGARAAGVEHVTIAITCMDAAARLVFADVMHALAGLADTDVVEAPERETGMAYYRDLCFKVFASARGQRFEVGDGGFVDWTAKLLGSRKERLLISGYGLDRLALLRTR